MSVYSWAKIIGMSATLSNGAELAAWLGASLHVSDYRPVPLDERLLVSAVYTGLKSDASLPPCARGGMVRGGIFEA